MNANQQAFRVVTNTANEAESGYPLHVKRFRYHTLCLYRQPIYPVSTIRVDWIRAQRLYRRFKLIENRTNIPTLKVAISTDMCYFKVEHYILVPKTTHPYDVHLCRE